MLTADGCRFLASSKKISDASRVYDYDYDYVLPTGALALLVLAISLCELVVHVICIWSDSTDTLLAGA